MKQTSISDFIPAGKQIISTEQDKILITHITQVISITSNLSNSEGQKLFVDPKWVEISDNYVQSVGAEKGASYGTDVFMVFFQHIPTLAYIEGAKVFGLDPHSMEARFLVMAKVLDDMFVAIPSIIKANEEKAAAISPAPTPAEKAPKAQRKPRTPKAPATSK